MKQYITVPLKSDGFEAELNKYADKGFEIKFVYTRTSSNYPVAIMERTVSSTTEN